MNKTIGFHSVGNSDYMALMEKYHSARQVLGDQFKNVFKANSLHYAEWPDTGIKAIKHYRYFRNRPFPYKVSYQKSETGIVIMTICHDKRHPRVWKKMLEYP